MRYSITVPCGALSTPEFGQFTFSTDGTTTTATFSCNLYATMNGERLVDCLTDGTWSHSAPSCGKIGLLWIFYVFSVFGLLCLCVRLFAYALWSPAEKGLTS